MNVSARGEIKNENIDNHPYKKPKIEMDVKHKVEVDIKIKTEPIEEFNRSIEIITNMDVPANGEIQNEKIEPKMKKVPKKKKVRFAWGSGKNFQYKFFNYLMTNNNVGMSEIVQKFFHGLDFESLLQCRLVCKAWYRFLNQFPSFWMDSLIEVREKFLYEPRNYMKRWRILHFEIVDEETSKKIRKRKRKARERLRKARKNQKWKARKSH